MADDVDRVFVHALNTVKKLPKAGAERPGPADRLRLYGLYKQAMEGDVDGVMARPTRPNRPVRRSSSAADGAGTGDGETDVKAQSTEEDEQYERELAKWEAWNRQAGLSRYEAKRKYIETLIEIMNVYTHTRQSVALASKLEAEWNEIKDGRPPTGSVSNQAAAAATQAAATSPTRHFAQPLSGTDGPMKVLSPMSEDDEAEVKEDVDQAGGAAVPEAEAPEKESGAAKKPPQHSETWQRKMERAVIKLAAEVAALREQITTGREWRAKKERSFPAWIAWLAWLVMKHIAVDFVILAVVLFWMRRRKDPRLEDLVRAALRLGREYARGILPSR